MARREECIARISRETGRPAREVEETLGGLLDRADELTARGMSPANAMARAGQDFLDIIGEDEAVFRRAAQIDAMTRADRHAWFRARIAEGHDPALVMTAKIVGVNTPFDRSRKSAEATHGALVEKYLGGFALDLERAHLDRLFASRTIEKEWTDELAEVNSEHGRPGITGNAQALEIARLVHKWQRLSMNEINDAGGWVRSYTGYVTRTEHDPDLIRTGGRTSEGMMNVPDAQRQDAARAKWMDAIRRRVDLGRTFGSLDLNQVLPELWERLARGEHFEIRPIDEDNPTFANVAAKASAHREIHFKSAADWRAYMAEFGTHDPTSAVVHAFDVAARRVALLQHFGTKPRSEFENDLAYLKGMLSNDPTRFRAFERQEQFLRTLYDQLDFSNNKPANRTWSRLVAGTMAINRWSKLGRVLFTHIASLPTKSEAGRYLGLSMSERYGGMLTDAFRGMEGSEKRQLAELTMAGADAQMGNMVARYDVADQTPGIMARIDRAFFKLTGVQAVTENQRRGFEAAVARHYGMLRGRSWADVGAKEARAFSLYGIGEAEWNALHTVDWSEVGGKTYLMPPDARKLSDDAVRIMLTAKNPRADVSDRSVRLARERLADTLHAMLWDQGSYAILRPTARARAWLFQGTQQSNPNLYKALQLLWQFRIWPMSMIERTWGRMVYGGGGNMDKVAAVTELVVASAVFGVLAEGLREISQGQDPISRIQAKPGEYLLRGFLRSGAATLAGDYLFGEFDRHGHSILGSLAGPTYGQAENLMNLRNEFLEALTKGKWAAFGAGLTHELRGNIPGIIPSPIPLPWGKFIPIDMWWTFHAFDYLVTYRLLEWMNPGYLQRYERRMKQERGIEYMLKPSALAG